MVGRMILAHVMKGLFPARDWVWVRSVAGVVNAHMLLLFGR